MEGGTAYLCTADADGMGGLAHPVELPRHRNRDLGRRPPGCGCTIAAPGSPSPPDTPTRPLPASARSTRSRRPCGRTPAGCALLLGTRGGHQQPQYLLQTAALLFAAGAGPERRPGRAPLEHGPRRGREPPLVSRWSGDTPDAIVAGLARRGHAVERVADRPPGWGPVSIISAADGVLTAAADPRVTTASAEAL